jgi:Zn-dependent protease with chaperone function
MLLLQFLIAIPLLLAVAASEWPTPAWWLGPAPTLVVVWLGLWLHVFLPAIAVLGWQRWNAHRGPLSAHGQGWLSLATWAVASLSLTWGWGWSHWVTRVTDNHGLWATTLILLPHLFGLQWVWTSPSLPLLWNASRLPGWSVWRLWQHIATDLLARMQWYLLPVLLPLMVVVGGRELLECTPIWTELDWMTQVVTLTVGSMAVVWLIFPLALGCLLPTSPLDDPILRAWSHQISRSLRLGCREVTQWDTQHRVANAMVLGGLPGCRKILISDLLCRALNRSEVGAVFLHEAGHLRRYHLGWRMATLAMAAQVLLLGIEQADAIGLSIADDSLERLGGGFLAFSAWLVTSLLLLGFVSRSLEFDADAFVVDQALQHKNREGGTPTLPTPQPPSATDDSLPPPATEPPGTELTGAEPPSTDLTGGGLIGEERVRVQAEDLVAALKKTAILTQSRTDRATWLHPSVDQRIARIGDLQASAVFRRLANRRLTLMKLLLLLGLALALLA